MFCLHFDGGSRGNPGPSGCGAVITTRDSMIWSGSQFLGSTTNNVAEYSGLLLGLQAANSLGIKELTIQGDSNLVVQQVNGKWKVKNSNLQILHQKVISELKKIDKWTLTYIPRAENSVADQLANDAMDRKN